MVEKKKNYFSLKFWPDREHRRWPSDENLDFDNPDLFEMLKYRNEMRLFYINWYDVWETYNYIHIRFVPFLMPCIWLITGKWTIALPMGFLWIFFKGYVIDRHRNWLAGVKLLVPMLVDKMILEHYGPQLPFDSEQILP
jgi:hypothetical protein